MAESDINIEVRDVGVPQRFEGDLKGKSQELSQEEGGIYPWYVVFVLMGCYALSFIDRQVLSLLVEPIKRDLAISDTQFGILQGLAFAIFYTFIGLFMGRLADNHNRRYIIAAGVTAWSLMTALCGLSKTYIQLFCARVGVAVGEAALSPAAYSVIGDYFPPSKIGRAMSTYTIGVYLGSGLAFLLGGVLIATLPETATLPVVGELKNWQLIFGAVGLPGLVFTLLVLTVKEPKRGRFQLKNVESKLNAEERQGSSVLDALSFFLKNWRMYLMHNVGFSMLTLIGYAYHAWTPTYFIRSLGWEASEIGMIYGAIALVTAPAGVMTGGWFGDWLQNKGYRDAYLRAPVLGAVALLLPASLATLSSNAFIALSLLAILQFFASFHGGMAVASLHTVTPIAYRAQATAIYLFFINLIGLGMGPVLVALATDYVFADEMAVGSSLALVSVVVMPLAIFFLWRAKNQYSITLRGEESS